MRKLHDVKIIFHYCSFVVVRKATNTVNLVQRGGRALNYSIVFSLIKFICAKVL